MGVELKLRILSKEELHARCIATLGLDSTALDLTFPEAIASAIRRAAGLLCPCSARTLTRAVIEPVKYLVEDFEDFRETVEEILEALIAYGDLLEIPVLNNEKGKANILVYAAPPSFVWRKSGAALLLGITPDFTDFLPPTLEECIEYRNHIRILPPDSADDLKLYLCQLGLIELSKDYWLKRPETESCDTHLRKFDMSLDRAPRSGEIPELMIIDSRKPNRFYRGRWVEIAGQTGRFVGRRPQAYGADLWCYVELENGQPIRFIDLPIFKADLRGCDEAWRLQAAIDCFRGEPQRFRISEGPNKEKLVDFFSPVPMWARRQWDSIGQLVLNKRSSLFSYRFSETELNEELEMMREKLWLEELR